MGGGGSLPTSDRGSLQLSIMDGQISRVEGLRFDVRAAVVPIFPVRGTTPAVEGGVRGHSGTILTGSNQEYFSIPGNTTICSCFIHIITVFSFKSTFVSV